MATDGNGNWIGWGIGDTDPKVAALKAFMRRKFASYAGDLADTPVYDDAMVAAVKQMQANYGLPVTGVINYKTQVTMGFIKPNLPIMFTVEGHDSNMDIGPVAGTGEQLESEGRCHHQPIGYNSGALPFDNQSGVTELARLVGAPVMDNGVPFPGGTPWALGGFSQGGIVVSYFYFDYLAPGKPLNWRLKDLKGVLAYGNPCRQKDSIAPWAVPWTHTGTHGLDPYRRFGLPGYGDKPDNWMDVWRTGDIFTDNGDDEESQLKSAVYEAVMNDWFSSPYSIAAKLSTLFGTPFPEIVAIAEAIISGLTFVATNPSPHYGPYDITGGVDWMRGRLAA